LRYRTLKLGLTAATILSATIPLALVAPTASYADYAPSKNDVVGVGADVLTYFVDFLADGDAYGDTGYNQVGNKYKLISFDASADANARLAYGVDGGQTGQSVCSPGTGSAAGTANSNTTNTGIPCVLNPTIVLRAGTQPVPRPNGSGAGFKAFQQDILAGHNAFGSNEVINFARSSATEGSSLSSSVAAGAIDQLTIATDPLPMLVSSTHTGSDGKTTDYPLSANQLSDIYAANNGSCLAWSTPIVSGVQIASATFTSGSTTVTWTPGATPQPTSADVGWNVIDLGTSGLLPVTSGSPIANPDDVVSVGSGTLTLATAAAATATVNIGLVNPSASADQIIPIISPAGTGTRQYFLSQLNPALTNPGSCSVVAEESDPTAIHAQTNAGDAIEPMSQGRLDLFKGVNNAGTSGGLPSVGYFLDPSCAYESGTTGCGTGTVGGSPAWQTNAVSVSNVVTQSGSPADGNTLFDPTRSLYLYVRSADVTASSHWQPTGTLNWVNELFYNPAANGTTIPFPYISQAEGQTLLEDAGVTPTPVTCQVLNSTNTGASC
jgi:hypothetical protein